jgi:MOSC domain-containing protein YiiM
MTRPHLEAICVGETRPLLVGRQQTSSGIDKRPVAGPVAVGFAGADGDVQVDTQHHGGPDQALYAYAREDADHWAAVLERAVEPGAFGENLRTVGVDVTAARIGERWRIGRDVVVAVTAPRIPCSTFAAFWDVPDLIARFLDAGRPGAYLRVLEPGVVRAGDAIEVVYRPDHDISVAEVSRIHTRDRADAVRLVELDGLASRVRSWVDRTLGLSSG